MKCSYFFSRLGNDLFGKVNALIHKVQIDIGWLIDVIYMSLKNIKTYNH
ncbi:hypothetical protein [Emticicia sp. SJ17W-69]